MHFPCSARAFPVLSPPCTERELLLYPFQGTHTRCVRRPLGTGHSRPWWCTWLPPIQWVEGSIPSCPTTLINTCSWPSPTEAFWRDIEKRSLAHPGPQRTAHLPHPSFRSTMSRLTDSQPRNLPRGRQ